MDSESWKCELAVARWAKADDMSADLQKSFRQVKPVDKMLKVNTSQSRHWEVTSIRLELLATDTVQTIFASEHAWWW